MARKGATMLAVAISATLAAAATIDKRIVGGEDANIGDFPFLVSIRNQDGIQFCGGSLLDSTTVLTAGHCVKGSSYVKAGSLNRLVGGVGSLVTSKKTHPDYDLLYETDEEAIPVHDIGILKLLQPIEKNDTIHIGFATLPADGHDPAVNSTAVAAGWGRQHESGFKVDMLSKVVIPIQARKDCPKANDTTICAGGNGKTVCKGDSGGPLVDEKTQQVIGISSWVPKEEGGHHCNLAPASYTRVGSYIPFIEENLGGSLPVPDEEMLDALKTQQVYEHCDIFGSDKRGSCLSSYFECAQTLGWKAATQEIIQCIDVLQKKN
ncbi:hypothetical protein MY5147_008448 [Beauveria neobassiana]|uniref:Peptidase S1 domain-containing protein n=1 Tax=Beauveria bassiana TaxID=176275 RepID=A0A2S7YIU6_BEABA|nr:hypothetical protein BB8028_0006g00940 [Beauveria bassiana]